MTNADVMDDRVVLTSRDTSALQGIMSVLAQPMNYASSVEWMTDAAERLQRLLTADKVLSLLAVPDGKPPLLIGLGDNVDHAIKQWLETYYPFDYELEKVRAARGGSVYHRDLVWNDPNELNRTLLYREWMQPNGLCDLTGIALDAPDGSLLGVLHAYHVTERRLDDSAGSGAFGRRGLAIMQLLTPAFQAAVRLELTAFAQTRGTLQFVDHLSEPAFVVGENERILHANPNGTALLGDPCKGDALRRTVIARGRELLSTSRGGIVLERCRPTLPGAAGRSAPPWAGSVVTFGRVTVALLILKDVPSARTDPVKVGRALGLTPRQAQIALWISDGVSTREIATRGAMTLTTVRRHLEAIFVRVGCHSRAELVARVLSIRV